MYIYIYIYIYILTGLRERDKREKSEEKIDCHHQDSNQGPSLIYIYIYIYSICGQHAVSFFLNSSAQHRGNEAEPDSNGNKNFQSGPNVPEKKNIYIYIFFHQWLHGNEQERKRSQNLYWG